MSEKPAEKPVEEKHGSVKITKEVKAGAVVYTTDRRLYETQDGRIVEEGDPEALVLVAGAGGTIDAKTAERLHLSEKGQQLPAPKPAPPVPSTVPGAQPEQPIAEPGAPPRPGALPVEPPREPTQLPADEDDDANNDDEEGKPRRRHR